MIKGIGHVAFVTEDMEKSLHFYCDILELRRIYDLPDDEGNPWLIYLKVTDRQFIELFYNGKRKYVKKDFDATGSTHICLQVDDINEIAQRLTSNGCILDIPPMQGKDYNYQCWTKDPDGNNIEFMQIDPKSPQANA